MKGSASWYVLLYCPSFLCCCTLATLGYDPRAKHLQFSPAQQLCPTISSKLSALTAAEVAKDLQLTVRRFTLYAVNTDHAASLKSIPPWRQRQGHTLGNQSRRHTHVKQTHNKTALVTFVLSH